MKKNEKKNWSYLVLSVVLKVPVGNGDNGESKKLAESQLMEEFKKLSPAYVHKAQFLGIVPLEALKEKNVCSISNTDTGQCETCD